MKNRIRKARIAQGLNLNELAKKANLSSRQLSDIEHCKCNPRINTLENISIALGIPLHELLCENEEKRPNNIAVLDGQGN